MSLPVKSSEKRARSVHSQPSIGLEENSTPVKKAKTDDEVDLDVGKTPRRKKCGDTEEEDEDIFENCTFLDDIDSTEENKGGFFSPKDMALIAERFFIYVDKHVSADKKIGTQKLKKLSTEFFNSSNIEVPVDKFLRSYHHYLKIGFANRSFACDKTLMNDVLKSNAAVQLYPDFPTRPPSLTSLYAKKHDLSIGFGKIGAVKKTMEDDPEGRRQIETELHLMEENFLKALKEFTDIHRDSLSADQVCYLEKLIKNASKKIDGNPTPIQRRKSKTPKDENMEPKKHEIICEKIDEHREVSSDPAVIFTEILRCKPRNLLEFYIHSTAQKYHDAPDDKKAKKLAKYQKKFHKLATAELDLLEENFRNL